MSADDHDGPGDNYRLTDNSAHDASTSSPRNRRVERDHVTLLEFGVAMVIREEPADNKRRRECLPGTATIEREVGFQQQCRRRGETVEPTGECPIQHDRH